MSIKWKYDKTVFRYTVDSPAIQSGYLKPQLPMQYELSGDPHEDSNLWYTDLTQGWICTRWQSAPPHASETHRRKPKS